MATILIVEDYAPVRENTAELLELRDYKVLFACNGAEGLEMALRHSPDLILSDIKMPVMNGYQFLQQIRKQPRLNKCPVVFFTALAEKKEIEKAMKMGAADYIVKPFGGDELLRKIKNLVSSSVKLFVFQLVSPIMCGI